MTEEKIDAPYTITYLEIISFKRVRAFRITPDGEMVVIGGWNKQGKTSVLDGITCLLNGKASVPAEPIHQGKRSGRIKAKFENKLGDHFTAERVFDAKGGTELHVRDKDGETPLGGAQTFLETLMGGKNPLAFDPGAFIRMDPPKQDAICRQICGVNFDDQNTRRRKLEEKRKDKNDEVKRLKLRFEDMPYHEDAPVKELDPSEVSKQLGELTKANYEVQQRVDAISQADARVREAEAHVLDLREKLARAEAHHATVTEARAAMPEAGEMQDVQIIQDQLDALAATNAKVRANAERDKARSAWEEAQEASKELTEQMQAIDDEKAELLSKATYPVPGMSFDEAGPTLNGFPIKQASGREMIELGVAIAFAQNPQLRIALVRHGSDFDPPALTALAEAMSKRGGQAWVEVVRVTDCDVVMEDGEIKAEVEPVQPGAPA